MATDYIPRDKAIEALVNLTVYNSLADIKSLVESKYHYQNEWIGGIKDALEEIDGIPAADVVERKTGKWKKHYADHEAFGVRPFFRYCSECNEATIYPYNFCPNRGADMRGVTPMTDYTKLIHRLRAAAEDMQRGVHTPAHIAVVKEAAKALEARDKLVKLAKEVIR